MSKGPFWTNCQINTTLVAKYNTTFIFALYLSPTKVYLGRLYYASEFSKLQSVVNIYARSKLFLIFLSDCLASQHWHTTNILHINQCCLNRAQCQRGSSFFQYYFRRKIHHTLVAVTGSCLLMSTMRGTRCLETTGSAWMVGWMLARQSNSTHTHTHTHREIEWAAVAMRRRERKAGALCLFGAWLSYYGLLSTCGITLKLISG